ncbi:protein-export chaperone SecB [Levilactobacillus brevis]|nr:protein-export chaperone SecB [Levilactobacillus brevis]
MAVLKFIKYNVQNMTYQRNENYHQTRSEIKMNPQVSRKIDIDENRINVTLSIVVGSLENENIPFKTSCAITGVFDYQPEEDNTDAGLDQLVRVNAVAILYPYVRSIITMLTTTSNEYPGYIMPTINVNKLLRDQEEA